MNAQSKRTVKTAAAVAAGLVAVLLPTGCCGAAPSAIPFSSMGAPGSSSTVVAPPTAE
jgi:uncharacterized membrane protein YraQ (UPF0718 family)